MRRGLLLATLIPAAAIPIAVVAWPHGRTALPRHVTAEPDGPPRRALVHQVGPEERATYDRVAREESAKLERRKHMRSASVPSTSWVSLGPSDSAHEFNGTLEFPGHDVGRPTAIIVDPRDANVVYVAASGGGVWKSYDFLSANGPTWNPTLDTAPNLTTGALAIDPDHPDTLYAGEGDFYVGFGDAIQKTTDGGGTWGPAVTLAGTYPNGAKAAPTSVRQIAVEQGVVMVATDAGLFTSSDGVTFTLVDLPNAGGGQLAESLWSVVPNGGGAWLASGVTACAPGLPPPGGKYGADMFGSDPDPQACPAGNDVAIWRSTDGTTWKQVVAPLTIGAGQTRLATGAARDPNSTVVYVFVGAVGGFQTLGFWRSDDGGQTWKDATGTVANPTIPVDDGTGNLVSACGDINVTHGQAWYDQMIIVDPSNPDHVLVGGNLCGMRTLNGTSASPTWENVSHWLPGYGSATANGDLPYVHADWHGGTVAKMGGQMRAFALTDGGVYASGNVFDPATPAEQVTWTHQNRGLATHDFYALASGDPANGDPFVLFGGLQDNSTVFRADPAHPATFNEVVGGDGIGAVVHHSTAGTIYWGSAEYYRAFCDPAKHDCSIDDPNAQTYAQVHWMFLPSAVGPASQEPDEVEARIAAQARAHHQNSEPFLIHYADVPTDTTGESVLTHTDSQVFVSTPTTFTDLDGGTVNAFAWTPISQDLTSSGEGIHNVNASRTIAGLYGAVGRFSDAPFFVTTQGNTMSTWTQAHPVSPSNDAWQMQGPTYLDFPPVTPQGKQPGDVYIGSFAGTMFNTQTFESAPPPDDKGRLYRTTDGGKTWTSIVGADPAHRLPNIAINVVKYDPVTPTTIYAGTDLGMYFSIDDGATWDRMGDNFPMASVRDIYVAKNQDFIRVATYGRGLWEIYPSASANHGAPGNGDYDRNLRIDWVDVGAMASRLGTTPVVTTPPYYSWILDMSDAGSDPPVQAIDETDLAALLPKFGGHP